MILALVLAAGLGVTDLDGQPVDPFDARRGDTSAIVLAFVQPDCPVSNRYVPELNRLYTEYSRRNVKMWVVYAGVDRLALLRAHRAAYRLSVPALADPRLTLADKVGATMTAEAAVFVVDRHVRGGWELAYRGRIDDRAHSISVWRPVASVHDLAEVLRRLVNGEPITYRTTRAVGCYLRP